MQYITGISFFCSVIFQATMYMLRLALLISAGLQPVATEMSLGCD